MSLRVICKSTLFGISIFMLLLTMGYGASTGAKAPVDPNARYSGQVKIAKPGARLNGSRTVKVVPDTVPIAEISIFESIRQTTTRWMGGGNMMSADRQSSGKTELQKLQRRGTGGGMATAVVGN